MFEKIVGAVIQLLKKVTKELERAYYETFGDKASEDGVHLSNEFFNEILKRRKINKNIYIKSVAGFIGRKTLQEQGFIMPPNQAIAVAEAMFTNDLNNGKIDFLNNVKSEE